MIASSRRSNLCPPVTREFEFTRIQDQLIVIAYQALIPVISRSALRRRREPVCVQSTTVPGLRSRARGA
jgi:hypothetical protein